MSGNSRNRKLLLGEDKAQAEVAARGLRRVAAPARGAAVSGRAVPVASADQALSPTACASRVGLGVAAVIAIPVLTPFKDVA